jgi:PIN domain nuclease of toxin-antitoxin system
MGFMTVTGSPVLAHLDTHILVWLYRMPQRAWPDPVRVLLDSAVLRYSPMARLELHFLHQIGRINVAPADLLLELGEPLQLRECGQSFAAVVEHAQTLTWTRDPFDRLIVAQAITADAKLITHDENIRANFAGAVWK